MGKEKLTSFNNYGLWVDPDELKKCSHITIWGQMLMEDHTIGPWVRILKVPIDIERIKKKSGLIGTYISCEVDP